jgi:hypothetical protein
MFMLWLSEKRLRAITVVAAALYEVDTPVGRACRWYQKPVQNGDRSASEDLEERPMMRKTYSGRQGLR